VQHLTSVTQDWQESGVHRLFCHSWLDLIGRILSAMDIFLILLLVLALYAALEPQHRRSAGTPSARTGSSGSVDRDEARRLADLHFLRRGGSRA
jgi:hypothetical protein